MTAAEPTHARADMAAQETHNNAMKKKFLYSNKTARAQTHKKGYGLSAAHANKICACAASPLAVPQAFT